MTQNPLLLFPEPIIATKHTRHGGPPSPPLIPSADRQIGRLRPKFEVLENLVENERLRLQSSLSGVESEKVLVLETVGAIDEFVKAVRRTTGLEWLADFDVDDISPDEDFYVPDDRDKALSGRLYMLLSNLNGLQQLLSLWRTFQENPLNPQLGFGLTKYRDLFKMLRDIRPWGPQDRLHETGLLSYWQEQRDAGEDRVYVEIELWYRSTPEHRGQAEQELRQLIESEQGSVISSCSLFEILYHAVLAELPIQAVERLLNQNTQLIHCERVMFFRPIGQMVVPSATEEPILSTDENPEHIATDQAPVVALLDGYPLANHLLLANRLIIDDPDDWGSEYSIDKRIHGTAMSSLIVHGDLNAGEPPLGRPLYVRPVLKPSFNNESTPENQLLVDLIHRSVKRLFEGEDNEPPVADQIRIINFSIAYSARPFHRFPCPLARLFDWLSLKYRVLFLVSAGNITDDIILDKPKAEFTTLRSDPASLRNEFFKYAYKNGHLRRILQPAESINALTIGASHIDTYTGDTAHPVLIDIVGECEMPSPVNPVGFGFRRATKPDILFPGGRQFYRLDEVTENPNVVLKIVEAPNHPPGQQVATPTTQPGILNAVRYTRGTSNATALATRAAARLYEILDGLKTEPGGQRLDEEYTAILLKALLAHSTSWDDEGKQCLINALDTADKNTLARFLCYGNANIERVMACTENRVTLLGWGILDCDEAHQYSFPLPSNLNVVGFKKLATTLAWFSPINPNHQGYRNAHLWFDFSKDDTLNTLQMVRSDLHAQSVQRGTIQHEILAGDRAIAVPTGQEIQIKINCRSDAGDLTEAVPYGLAVTLEVAPELNIQIYEEIREEIRLRLQPSVLITPQS